MIVAVVALSGAVWYATSFRPVMRSSEPAHVPESRTAAAVTSEVEGVPRRAGSAAPQPRSDASHNARTREGAVFGWLVAARGGASPTITLSLGELVPLDEFAAPGGPAVVNRSLESTALAFAPGAQVRLADGRTLGSAELSTALKDRTDQPFIARLVDGRVTELVEYDGTTGVPE